MSRIKECFVSRFKGGFICEVDFSQLEVVGAAVLSRDPVLKDDILSGRDMHRLRAAELFNIAPSAVSDEQRRLAKMLSFQLQYGAGYKSMALKNGIHEKLAKEFIKNYYDRYKVLKQWQDELMESVKANRKPTGMHTKRGYPMGVSQYHSPTGRIYTFKEYDAPEWARSTDPTFSPTEVKNYPIQGFATADVMAVYRAKMYRALMDKEWSDKCLSVNTVHDSIMYDVTDLDTVKELYTELWLQAQALPEHLKTLWGMDVELPFKVEMKIGPNWAELKPYGKET